MAQKDSRIMAAVCDCCKAHAIDYPFETFQVCARCGRGTYLPRSVTVEEHKAKTPRPDPFSEEGRRSHAA